MAVTKITITVRQLDAGGYVVQKLENTTEFQIGQVLKKSDIDRILTRKNYKVVIR